MHHLIYPSFLLFIVAFKGASITIRLTIPITLMATTPTTTLMAITPTTLMVTIPTMALKS